MAQKTTKSSQKWEVAFVSCELDKATKQLVRNWDVKYESTVDAVDRLIMDGYKISISFDKFHDCVGVFMTMPNEGHKHHGMCLSARAPGYLDALKFLVYKHFTVLQENWDSVVDQTAKRDQWG